MKKIPIDTLSAGERRAYGYMQDIVDSGMAEGRLPEREMVVRAALLKGFPVQDVFTAALVSVQEGMADDDIAAAPLPASLQEVFLRHVVAEGYKPSPIDVSHVEMTPAMEAVVGHSAAALHENWRVRQAKEGLTEADNPLLRPWDTLTPEEKAPTLSTAEGAVKVIAAVGGTTAAALDLRETRDALCKALDENIHDIWARNKMDAGARYGVGRTKDAAERRDVTHPDLVPFKDLSAASKSYDHDINVIILDTIRKEGIDIAGQKKEAIGKRNEEQKDVIKSESVPAEKAAVLEELFMRDYRITGLVKTLADVTLKADAEAGQRAGLRGLPPREDVAYSNREAWKRLVEIASEKGFRFKHDMLMENPEGKPVGIILTGMPVSVGENGEPSPEAGVLRFGAGWGSPEEYCGAYYRAIHDGLKETGMTEDRFLLKNPARGFVMENLRDKEVSDKYLQDAALQMKRFLDKGFFFETSVSRDGMALDGSVGRILSKDPAMAPLVSLLAGQGVSVSYKGQDRDIVQAVRDDMAAGITAKIRDTAQRQNRKITEVASTLLSNTILNHINVVEENPAVLGNQLEVFMRRLKDGMSFEAALLNAMPDLSGGRSDCAAFGARQAMWTALTGTSWKETSQMVAGNDPVLKMASVGRSVSELMVYKKAMKEYEAKGAVARLFSRKPAFPEAALKAVMVTAMQFRDSWDRYVQVEGLLDRSVTLDDGRQLRLVGDSAEYLKTIGQGYREKLRPMLDAVTGLIVDGARGMVEELFADIEQRTCAYPAIRPQDVERCTKIGVSARDLAILNENTYVNLNDGPVTALCLNNGQVNVVLAPDGRRSMPLGQYLFMKEHGRIQDAVEKKERKPVLQEKHGQRQPSGTDLHKKRR